MFDKKIFVIVVDDKIRDLYYNKEREDLNLVFVF